MSTTIVHATSDSTAPSRITIFGRVFVPSGTPAVGLTVNARERGLRGGNIVATAQTGRFGDYSLAFDVAKLTLAGGGRSSVQLEVTTTPAVGTVAITPTSTPFMMTADFRRRIAYQAHTNVDKAAAGAAT